MHDIWYASKIIILLKEKIGPDKKYKSASVNVVLGPFTHVTKESLISAFEVLNEKEGFKNVSLNIKKNKAAIECKKCGVTTQIEKAVTACPKCNCNDFNLKNTEEFIIESIEIG